MGTAPWCAASRSETDTEGAFLGDGLKAARTGILLRSRCRVEGRVGRLGGQTPDVEGRSQDQELPPLCPYGARKDTHEAPGTSSENTDESNHNPPV